MSAIHVISPSEFKQNQKKFFDLAETERVVIKRGKKLFELVAMPFIETSVSPSNDPWFSNPQNLAALDRRIAEHKKGENIGISLTSAADVKSFLRGE